MSLMREIIGRQLSSYNRLLGFNWNIYKRSGCILPKQLMSTFTEPFDSSKYTHRKKSRFFIINWFYDDVFKGRAKMNAFFLYAEMTKTVNYLDFFKIAKLDDTFNSWFLVTELHVWMILVRLRGEGKIGKAACSSLVAALWDDTAARAKVLSPGDNSVSKKQIQILGQEFKATLLLYDEALLSSDTVLASAIWYRLLSKSCDDPRILELLTAYIREQMSNLESFAKEDLLVKAELKWKPLPMALVKNMS